MRWQLAPTLGNDPSELRGGYASTPASHFAVASVLTYRRCGVTR